MLSFSHPSPHPLGRREFLQIGGLGLGSLALGNLASGLAHAAPEIKARTGKSVVFCFMQGGPSQFETFDPKPDIPDAKRTVGGVTKTSVPGVNLGAAFPKLAKHAHRLAIVRSFYTNTGHGALKPIVSETTKNCSINSIYSRVVGNTNPETGLPNSLFLKPQSVDAKQATLNDRFGDFDAAGFLGSAYAPFTPGSGVAQDNLKLRMSPKLFEERRRLLAALDQARAGLDGADLDGVRQQAYDVLLKGVMDAFDLSKEDPRTIARYDTGPFYNPALWGKKNNAKWYTAHMQTIGKLMLLARRLVEAGCGLITLHTEFVWDMHEDGNNLSVKDGQPVVMTPFDHAVSAFIEDIEARGLSDKVLLVCCGEMGRTPKLTAKGGRGHWGALAPLILYGGGLTHGQVIGRSDPEGGRPASNPMSTDNLLATIIRTVIDHGQARLIPDLPPALLQILDKIDQTPGVI